MKVFLTERPKSPGQKKELDRPNQSKTRKSEKEFFNSAKTRTGEKSRKAKDKETPTQNAREKKTRQAAQHQKASDETPTRGEGIQLDCWGVRDKVFHEK